jgi:hypothetical protein
MFFIFDLAVFQIDFARRHPGVQQMPVEERTTSA